MSDETVNAKTRGPASRFYVDAQSGTITRRCNGEDELCPINDIPEDRWHRIAAEGYIMLRIKGASHEEIRTGAAYPDRVMPTEKVKGARVGKPSAWVEAIASVKCEQTIKTRRAGGEKVPGSEIPAMQDAALAWARSLPKESVAEMKKLRVVLVAHATLVGDDKSLDDLAQWSAPGAAEESEAVQQAAE